MRSLVWMNRKSAGETELQPFSLQNLKGKIASTPKKLDASGYETEIATHASFTPSSTEGAKETRF
ncbi:hypothetical protein ACS0TY_011924 [Phlomoides rotata]